MKWTSALFLSLASISISVLAGDPAQKEAPMGLDQMVTESHQEQSAAAAKRGREPQSARSLKLERIEAEDVNVRSNIQEAPKSKRAPQSVPTGEDRIKTITNEIDTSNNP